MVSLLKKQEPKFSVPSLADTSAEYRRLTDKRDKLAAQLGKLQTEHSELFEEIARETIPLGRREQDARIAQLLDDESVTAISRPHVRLSEINREITDIKAALDVLADQIGQARYRASETILENLRLEYGQRVAGCCEALLKLREASAAYFELVDELSAKDISWTPLNPMPVGFCGNPHDRYSKYGLYLREAAQHNYFPYDKIPNELR